MSEAAMQVPASWGQQLVDLAPLIELLLLGAGLALLPAAVVVWRARRQGVRGWPAWQRVLTVATLFLTLDLVIFGAFTRLTDSGLGCPDWPGCYGEMSPFHARDDIHAAHAVAPQGPVSPTKAWIEMIHRYLATAVGALITGLMVLAWRQRDEPGALSPWWATLTFVWVCVQGAFGAFTVTMKLQPLIVTGHLLGALLGVALLTTQARVLDPAPLGSAEGSDARRNAWAGSGLRRAGFVVLGLLTVQIALGAWVSTNYAVLACTEFPTCQGQWWPAMDFEQAARLWRPLGGDGQGGVISMAGLTAIHMAHRLFAGVVALALVVFAWQLARWRARAGEPTVWRREARVLGLLLLAQLLSGLSNVVLGWPLVAALAHTFGAALMVWWLTRLLVLPRAQATWLALLQGRQGPHDPSLVRSHQGLHATAPRASAS
jgi:cytochrome c oxidase assembly protein subunit 15